MYLSMYLCIYLSMYVCMYVSIYPEMYAKSLLIFPARAGTNRPHAGTNNCGRPHAGTK